MKRLRNLLGVYAIAEQPQDLYLPDRQRLIRGGCPVPIVANTRLTGERTRLEATLKGGHGAFSRPKRKVFERLNAPATHERRLLGCRHEAHRGDQ